MKLRSFLLLCTLSLVAAHPAIAADFYRGKSDSRHRRRQPGRRLRYLHPGHGAPHGQTYSGQPSLIVENMTGAGTFIAAKYVHGSAKPDGLSIGMFNGGLILGRVPRHEGIDIDMRELEYLGVPVQDNPVCALSRASGVTNMEQWASSKTPIKLGGFESRQQHQRRRAHHSKLRSICRCSWLKATKEPMRSVSPVDCRRAARRLLGLGKP